MTARAAERRETPLRKWGNLLVLSLALAIIIIDITLLNVSLSTLIRELHTNLQSLQWVISAYSLTLAALTVTGGRMGDLFGRKRMFKLGAFVFAVGSFIGSAEYTPSTLVAFKITSALISSARNAAAESVEKKGLPVPAAKITIRPFSK